MNSGRDVEERWGTRGEGRFVWRKAASIGEVLRSPSPDGASLSDRLVEVTRENERPDLEAQVPDEKQERDAHLPSLRAFVVDVHVGDGKEKHDWSGALPYNDLESKWLEP